MRSNLDFLMLNIRSYFSLSVTSLCFSVVAILAVVYLGLIAVVMSYAALTVEFSQSMKNDEAGVAVLESAYLNHVSQIQGLDYHSVGYVTPLAKTFVPGTNVTAMR